MHCYFAVSKVCNLRCRYCYVPEHNKNQQVDYDEKALFATREFVKKIEKEKFHIDSVTLHGAEPTILSSETLGEIINLFSSAANNDVRIQSNGTRLTPSYLDRLIKVIKNPNKLFVGISMDGSANIHNSQRNNTWDLITRNIMELRERRFEVGLLAVITSETLKHLREFGYWVEYMKPLVRGITFKMGEHGYSLKASENARFAEWLYKNKHIKHLQAFMPDLCIHDGNQCEFYEFDLDGNCYSCNKNYNDSGTFANWHEDSFKTIVKKREILYGTQAIDPECKSCSYQSLCHSGCPLSRENGKSVDCLVKKNIYSKLTEVGVSNERFFSVERQSTILAVLRSTFPKFFSMLDNPEGTKLVEDFEDQEAYALEVHQIPSQFLSFIKKQSRPKLSAFLLELADYEFTLFNLGPAELKCSDTLSQDACLADARPIFNPCLTLKTFSYPVHTVANNGWRKRPKARKTELLFWCKAETVQALPLKPVSARLLSLFLNDSSLTVGKALENWRTPNEALGILKALYDRSIIVSWASTFGGNK
ncbi:MAG: radical SAM protein [Deltaproteobacteria bacterium]|nr:radical SAM protein [Deltaproteobacteria bacterium]